MRIKSTELFLIMLVMLPRGQELSPTYYKQVEREVKDAARFGISKDVDPEDFAVK